MGFFDSVGDFFSDIFTPGARQADEANKLNKQAIANQSGLDAWKQKLIGDRLNMSQSLLTGGGINGVPVMGALPRAQDWQNKFFNFLQTSPDTTFNAQKSSLARSFSNAENQLAQAAANRGISTSGINLGNIANLNAQKASAMSNLQGQRVDRQGQRINQGLQFAQSLLDNALNMGNAASGMATGFSTAVPGLMSNYAGNLMSQANTAAAGGSIGQQLLSDAFGQIFRKDDSPARIENDFIDMMDGGFIDDLLMFAM